MKVCIERAERSFQTCWEYLCQIKSRGFSKNSNDCLIKFQPELANALLLLNREHKKLAGEKKKFISRKASLDAEWFRVRMKTLSRRQKLILSAINIGKGLGDAFALFFYHQDSKYLREHLKQDAIPYGPTGLGAIGELEFIRNMPLLHGYFVFFHGTTSLLRLGDVSLIDLSQFTVAGVGEIKSHAAEPGVVQIELILYGPGIDPKNLQARFRDPSKTKMASRSVSESMDGRQRDRLKRQLSKIAYSFDTLEKNKLDSRSSLAVDLRIASLEKAIRRATSRRISCEILNDGLVIGAYKTHRKTLWARLSATELPRGSGFFNGVEKYAVRTTLEGRSDNSLFVSAFYYDVKGRVSHLPGMTHPVWWPIDMELLRKSFFSMFLCLRFLTQPILQ